MAWRDDGYRKSNVEQERFERLKSGRRECTECGGRTDRRLAGCGRGAGGAEGAAAAGEAEGAEDRAAVVVAGDRGRAAVCVRVAAHGHRPARMRARRRAGGRRVVGGDGRVPHLHVARDRGGDPRPREGAGAVGMRVPPRLRRRRVPSADRAHVRTLRARAPAPRSCTWTSQTAFRGRRWRRWRSSPTASRSRRRRSSRYAAWRWIRS